MKKIFGMLVMAGILLAMIPASVMAVPIKKVDEDTAIYKEAGYVRQYKYKNGLLNICNTELIGEEKIKNKYIVKQRLCNDEEPNKKYVKLRGIWGLIGDNESDGYFGGRIFRRGRFAVFKGLYNKTDNESFCKIFGIMKRGYFNGRVINPNNESCKITGLYKIDRENKTFKMRWMTRHNSGWAVARIIPTESV
jgi:hypothetical protein